MLSLSSIPSVEPTACDLPDATLSLPAVLAARARSVPYRTAFHEVRFEGRAPLAQPIRYGHLDAMVRAAAATFAAAGVGAGDRVLLATSSVSSFLAGLVGAACSGAVAVPLPALTDTPPRAYVDRIASVVANARPRVLLVDSVDAVEGLLSDLPSTMRVLSLPDFSDEGRVPALPAHFSASCALEDVSFLQYTSGSTGAPKGVVVRHGNIVANLRAIAEAARLGEGDVMLSWLPLFHDMGLMALLLGLYVGIPTYIAPTRAFALRPDTWLRAMTVFRATVSPAPNFAYDVVARRVPDRALEGIDLSSWRIAFVGAEPVVPDTVLAFVDRYARYGLRADAIRPAYGMAECTVAAAFPRAGEPLRFDCVDRALLTEGGLAEPRPWRAQGSVTYTSVGTALPGHRVRILDLDSPIELPQRRLGEIALSGPSVTGGYFGELVDGPRENELRTGDLGYLADGCLYVVDRLKDILVLAGRKYAPADIERVVRGVPGLGGAVVVAFSVAGDSGTDELCVAVAPPSASEAGRIDLDVAVRRAVHLHFGVRPWRVVRVRPRDLPKTSSGKIRRSTCRALLEAGQLGAPTRG
jgi:acyl-CoA synthetase (AMP-forming)/AMP-acid ligase II